MMRRTRLSVALVTVFLVSVTLSETQVNQEEDQALSQDDALREILKTRVVREVQAGEREKNEKEKKRRKKNLKKRQKKKDLKKKKKSKTTSSEKGKKKKKKNIQAKKKKKEKNASKKKKKNDSQKNKNKKNTFSEKGKKKKKKKKNALSRKKKKKNALNKKKTKKNNLNKKEKKEKKKNASKKKKTKKNALNKKEKKKNASKKKNKKKFQKKKRKNALKEKKKKKKNELKKNKKKNKSNSRKREKGEDKRAKKRARKEKKKERRKQRKLRKLRKQRNRQSNSTATAQCKQSDEVSTNCLQNAADAMTFLEKQATNFLNQWRRIQSFNKTINGKLSKNGVFANVTGYLLTALGGDSSNVSCGETSSRDTASAAKALDTYKTLKNCSTAITAACTMPASTVPADVITKFTGFCTTKFNEAKTAADDCRTNKQHTSNGTAACECWANVGAVISTIKSSSDCSASTYSKNVKKFKNACVETFMTCRKQEDASVQLVYTCGSGEVQSTSSSSSSSSSSGRLASHMSIMTHSSLQ